MDVTEISSDETILRRIPPPPDDSTKAIPGGGLRATSFRLQLRDGEEGLSCTRLSMTSPHELLQQLHLQGKSPDGWMVCRIQVADVRALDLEVVHVPTDIDPGHCEIRGTEKRLYTSRTASKLAKETRILTADELDSIQAGDSVN